MSAETVARRYATALADVVAGTGEVEPVKTELKSWENMLNAGGELFNAFHNPAIAHGSKEKVLERLIEKSKPGKTTANFLRILLSNNRLTDIKLINERFEDVLKERSGIAAAEIISSRELNETEKSELRTKLQTLTGKNLNIDFAIDKEIIGGVVTRIGSTVYDGSVKTQLENLKHQLING